MATNNLYMYVMYLSVIASISVGKFIFYKRAKFKLTFFRKDTFAENVGREGEKCLTCRNVSFRKVKHNSFFWIKFYQEN